MNQPRLSPPLFIGLIFILLNLSPTLFAHSPESLYLVSKSFELQAKREAAYQHFFALAQQIPLPLAMLREQTEIFARQLGWKQAQRLLAAQTKLLADHSGTLAWMELDLERRYQITSEWDPNTWRSRVTSTAQRHPKLLGLQTIWLSFHPEPKALISSLAPSTFRSASVDERVTFLRELQHRFPLGNEGVRAQNLAFITEYFSHLFGEREVNHPADVLSQHAFSDFLILTAQLDLAQAQLESQLKQNSESPSLLRRLYRLQIARDEPSKASETYLKLASIDALDLDFRLDRVRHLEQSRDYPAAIAEGLQILRHYPCPFGVYHQIHKLYLKSGPLDPEWKDFAKRTQNLFPEEAQAHYFAGLTCFFDKDFPGAVESLSLCETLAETSHPELLNLRFRHALGISFKETQNWTDAIRQFRKGLLQNSDDPELRAECFDGLAQSLLEVNQLPNEAANLSKMAIRTFPSRLDFYRTLVECQIRLGLAEEAQKSLAQAKQMESHQVETRADWLLTSARLHLLQNQTTEARQALTKALGFPNLSTKLAEEIQSEVKKLDLR